METNITGITAARAPTVFSRIVAAANAGMAPRDVAILVGWKPESVSAILSRARADGQAIRRHPAGRPKTRVGRLRGSRA